ncbi:hypothetical protein CK203_016960 [Vitis vinifera]|uniref:Uncharacterized protein n=1 Tax=Vitis vinifera TaxID=29760 RepID=A0A438JNK6_VITVI|nr:hypothetical protein CK203_016960 [Vitis vinifera]
MLPLHLLEFFNSAVTVNLASKLQPGEKPMALREMVCELFHNAKLKGPFITSVYVLLLSTCAFLGLVWLTANKYLDWSVEWNMSIVLSILKEPYGAEALQLACLQARCNVRGSGILIQVMLLCMGNVVKWMVFMVYFHNCKKRILRKAIAGEVGVEDKL